MEFKILAKKREKKEKLGKDFIPAVLYGNEFPTQSISLKKLDFEKTFSLAGESNLINLEIEGKSEKVLVKDVQKDAINLSPIHVDFYKVNMKEKVVTEIPLIFIGESKAVKELGGMLNKELDAIEVECFPGDLLSSIEVDITPLLNLDDVIRVSDLNLPKTLETTVDMEDVVVNIIQPKAQVEEEVVVEEVEGEGKDKKEDEKKEGDKKEGEKKEGENKDKK